MFIEKLLRKVAITETPTHSGLLSLPVALIVDDAHDPAVPEVMDLREWQERQGSARAPSNAVALLASSDGRMIATIVDVNHGALLARVRFSPEQLAEFSGSFLAVEANDAGRTVMYEPPWSPTGGSVTGGGTPGPGPGKSDPRPGNGATQLAFATSVANLRKLPVIHVRSSRG